MKKTQILALAAFAGSSVAMGTVRETASFPGPILSNGTLGAVYNDPSVTFTATGADGSGPYAVRQLRFNGTLASGFAGEAAVWVVPPSGTPFLIGPKAAAVGAVASSTIPVSGVGTAGTWTFTFFDTFDDGASSTVDATWTDVTIGFDDAAPATGFAPTAGQNFTFNNVLSDGLAAAGFTDIPFSPVAGTPTQTVRISGNATAILTNPAANVTTNAVSNLRFAVVNSLGVVSATVTPTFATNASSSCTFIGTASFPAPADSGGSWSLRVFQATDIAGGADVYLNDLMVSFVAPPAATTLPITAAGTWASANGTITNPGDVAWFTFTAPATLTATGFLDLDTTGSSLSPANDTDMAMYLANGNLVDSDEDDSADLLSQLSYGSGLRLRIGNGANFANQDGTIALASTTGIAPGGVYFVGVAGGNAAIHGTGWGTTGGANTGSVVLRGRALDSGSTVETPVATPLALTSDGTWTSANASIVNPGDVAWFTFTAPASLTATGYLDLSTAGSSLSPANDTDMALYLANGNLVDSDEDDNTDLLSQLSYGTGSRLRVGNGVNYSGQDGTIAAASTTGINPGGVYFVAVAGGNAATHGTGFNTNGGANTGSVQLSGRTINLGATVEVPAATTIALTEGTFASATASITNLGDVAWFTFTTPAGLDLTGALDIDVEGTNLTPANDTDMALYTTLGVVVDSDDNNGTDLLSQLSYGAGGRNATGNGLRFRGQSGTTAGTAGNVGPNTQYYIGVAGGSVATHGTAFNTTGSGPNTGSVTARVRVFSTGAPSDPITAPTAEDAGTFTSTVSVTEVVVTKTNTIANGNDIKWYKFTIPAVPAADPVVYLDIDTEGTADGAVETVGSLLDSELGLYDATGARFGDDDDGGNGFRSALSYGSTTVRPAIPAVAPALVGLARNGRSGGLAAGTFYASVGTFNSVQNLIEWDVVGPTDRAATVGDRKFNIRTNLTLQPSCICCSLSNVSGPGQDTVNIDNELTADDIIVFLNRFFAGSLLSNVSGPGQDTVNIDNELTADDIIVFLNRFFAGC